MVVLVVFNLKIIKGLGCAVTPLCKKGFYAALVVDKIGILGEGGKKEAGAGRKTSKGLHYLLQDLPSMCPVFCVINSLTKSLLS